MKISISRTLLALAPSVLAACTAATTISTPQSEVAVRIRDKSYATLPASDKVPTTTFGNFEFKAEQAGQEPFYGVLPLKFNGGYLALDILFFAPAMFFNLRGAFPEYQLDLEKRVVRYRTGTAANWTEHQPSPAETERSKRYFGGAP